MPVSLRIFVTINLGKIRENELDLSIFIFCVLFSCRTFARTLGSSRFHEFFFAS